MPVINPLQALVHPQTQKRLSCMDCQSPTPTSQYLPFWQLQAPATLVGTPFSSLKENIQLLPKYCLYQQNSRRKVVDLQKTQLMVLLQKIRAHT